MEHKKYARRIYSNFKRTYKVKIYYFLANVMYRKVIVDRNTKL